MKPLPDDSWGAWTPDELIHRLKGLSLDWYIVGGWALDLWHGRQTRDHEDLEFSVFRKDISNFRNHLSNLDFFAATDGILTYLAPTVAPPSDALQLWGADMGAGRWRVDMMVDQGTPEVWHYKRDPSLQLARPSAVRQSPAGIPYLAPAIVLLFKAKHQRPKDELDFQAALPKLLPAEKADLKRWLARFHQDHVWASYL